MLYLTCGKLLPNYKLCVERFNGTMTGVKINTVGHKMGNRMFGVYVQT